ncbi:hypothetical protein ACVILK_001625 [Bradyrhizobium embrapense]
MSEFEKIGVVGAGMMGSEVAAGSNERKDGCGRHRCDSDGKRQ